MRFLSLAVVALLALAMPTSTAAWGAGPEESHSEGGPAALGGIFGGIGESISNPSEAAQTVNNAGVMNGIFGSPSFIVKEDPNDFVEAAKTRAMRRKSIMDGIFRNSGTVFSAADSDAAAAQSPSALESSSSSRRQRRRPVTVAVSVNVD